MNVIEKEKAKFVISERKEDTHIVSLMVIILLFYFWLLTFFMFTIIQTFYSLYSSFIIILSSLLSYFIYLHISSYHSFNFSFIFSRTTTQSWKIWSSKLSWRPEDMAMWQPCCRFNGTGGLGCERRKNSVMDMFLPMKRLRRLPTADYVCSCICLKWFWEIAFFVEKIVMNN